METLSVKEPLEYLSSAKQSSLCYGRVDMLMEQNKCSGGKALRVIVSLQGF